jgi:hypothetical protein
MSALRAKQVNAIYRYVTMVYSYNYHSSGHYPLFKKNVLETEFFLCLQVELTQMGPIERASLCLCLMEGIFFIFD